MSVTFHEGDNRDVLRRLIADGVRVHTAAMDPPYGLVSVTKRFGKEGSTPAGFGTDGAFARASAGFMGSKWDGTGIERDPEFWRLVYDILLPGGYCLAFSSPRTGHWMACAMELAGFVMHPFLGWTYGSGMPKACNAQRAIDCHLCQLPGRHYESVLPRDLRPGDHVCPNTEEGRAWEGWAYGGQALKPALEPIYVAQKPFSEKNGALNFLKHGVGTINIDACRVPGEAWKAHTATGFASEKFFTQGEAKEILKSPHALGRHPANLLHDGSAEVLAMFPTAPGQQGNLKGHSSRRQSPNGVFGEFGPAVDHPPRGDSGSAARFFNVFPIGPDEYAAELVCDPIRYHAKAGKADRAGSKHPTIKPIGLMEWVVRLVTPPGGIVLDPFAGSGTTGQAALNQGFAPILIEADPRYAADIRRRFGLAAPQMFDPDVLALIGAPFPELEMVG